MQALADRLLGVLTMGDELEREFEARLVESSTLAFRVAYGVLRPPQGRRGRGVLFMRRQPPSTGPVDAKPAA